MSDTWYDRAKRRMEEINVTQEDLKKPLGVETRGAVGHYLNGRRHPTPDQFHALATTLKVSADWLLTGDDSLRAGESTAIYMNNEDLLAACMRTVDTLLTELKYPRKHPIWSEKYRSQLTAHTYRIALEHKGKIDERDLREKIGLVAKMA